MALKMSFDTSITLVNVGMAEVVVEQGEQHVRTTTATATRWCRVHGKWSGW